MRVIVEKNERKMELLRPTIWLKEFCDVLTKTRVFAVCKEYEIKRVAYIERIKVNEINFDKMSDRFFQRFSYTMRKVHSYM